MSCIFCKIVNGEIPSDKVYENDKVLAFRDIQPQAPVHVLIVPKCHTQSVMTLNGEEFDVLPEMFKAAQIIAKELNVDEEGFRLVLNTGENSGQTVLHLHMHLLAGKKYTDL